MTVHIRRKGGVALVTIDNPPVNALGVAVREQLIEAVRAFDANPEVAIVILIGAGRLFVGGADITEFDKPVEVPTLPDLIAAVEASRSPWIAAMHGVALGGGLELAMACRYRIATSDSSFALPEINLGIVPGAGGTQRLPRLVGLAEAVGVIAENRRLDAATAQRIGLIDAVIAQPLEEEALAFAWAATDRPAPPLARDRPLAAPDPAFWAEAEHRIARSARGNCAPLEALRVLRTGAEQGFAAGLAEERRMFLRLRQSAEAAALRHIFFAERAALRPLVPRGTAAVPVKRVGVVGAGLMGTGIAAALRKAELDVMLTDRDEAGRERGAATLRALFDAEARRSGDNGLPDRRMAGVRFATGLDALGDCDLVIEAVFEDLAIKRTLFAALEDRCRPDAVLATNTSYLDPRAVFAGLANPGRCIGLHFFSPAHVMKLLEIVPLPETRAPVRTAAHDLARAMGKIPVVSGICEGFIGNRILKRYRGEAERLVRAGLGPAAIDAAMCTYGFAMGPFVMQDMAGLEIAYLTREAARARGEEVPVGPVDLLVRAGRTGQKVGKGWYDYAGGSRAPQPSPEVAVLLAPLAVPTQRLEGAEIANLLVGAMAAEGDAILAEGIAASAADIDLVEVLGYGFPRHRGGPMFAAKQLRSSHLPFPQETPRR